MIEQDLLESQQRILTVQKDVLEELLETEKAALAELRRLNGSSASEGGGGGGSGSGGGGRDRRERDPGQTTRDLQDAIDRSYERLNLFNVNLPPRDPDPRDVRVIIMPQRRGGDSDGKRMARDFANELKKAPNRRILQKALGGFTGIGGIGT